MDTFEQELREDGGGPYYRLQQTFLTVLFGMYP